MRAEGSVADGITPIDEPLLEAVFEAMKPLIITAEGKGASVLRRPVH